MKKEVSILEKGESLGKMPWLVPEGYFEALSQNVLGTVRKRSSRTRRQLRMAIAGVSAAAAAVILGLFLSGTFSSEPGIEDFVYAQIMPVTDPYSIFYSQAASDEDGMTDEEIIDYLVYTGVNLEQMEDLSNENQ